MKLADDSQPEVQCTGILTLALTLRILKAEPYHAKAIARFKVALADPHAEILRLLIKNIGKILNGISYAELENDMELSVMIQTLLLVTSQNSLEEETLYLAQNIPAILLVYGADIFASELLPLIERLFNLTSASLAKVTLAACFHEVFLAVYTE